MIRTNIGVLVVLCFIIIIVSCSDMKVSDEVWGNYHKLDAADVISIEVYRSRPTATHDVFNVVWSKKMDSNDDIYDFVQAMKGAKKISNDYENEPSGYNFRVQLFVNDKGFNDTNITDPNSSKVTIKFDGLHLYHLKFVDEYVILLDDGDQYLLSDEAIEKMHDLIDYAIVNNMKENS
ncbi:hypothetical protein [Chengkuizengella sediminis]|uniref:hypothetical protein n=1 Tax=Chengkuizengella sediminis TaxID=1885917 RepID=UPI001389EB91|nr:hypothetical protein [Chengkuizengella sediminis]NDI33482.1 hypothetical protein [Chengkuizengella sediminis]